MSKHSIIVRISEGEIQNKATVRKFFEGLKDGGYLLEAKSTQKRSLQQNAWIHAILPDILEGLRNVGYNEVRTTEDAKDFIKALFFRKKISNGIDTVEIIEGTSEQSKLNFSEKAEDIIIWAQTYLGIDVAPPGEQTEIDYNVSIARYENEFKSVIVENGK